MMCNACINSLCEMYRKNLMTTDNEATFNQAMQKVKDTLVRPGFSDNVHKVYPIQSALLPLIDNNKDYHPLIRSDFIMRIVSNYCVHDLYNSVSRPVWYAQSKNMNEKHKYQLRVNMEGSRYFSFNAGINTLSKKGQAQELIITCVEQRLISAILFPELPLELVNYAMAIQEYVRVMFDLDLIDERLREFLCISFVDLIWVHSSLEATGYRLTHHIISLNAAINIMKQIKSGKNNSSATENNIDAMKQIISFLSG